MSRPVLSLLSALVGLAPATAFAAGADCPDGWFCEDGAPPAPAAPPGTDRPPMPTSPPAGAMPPMPASPAEGALPPRPNAPPGYNLPSYPPPSYGEREPTGEPGEPIEFHDPDADEEEEPPTPRVHRRRQYHEWGFNLHLEDALLGDKSAKASNAQMDGLGFGLRYRPLPPIAFEAGLDLLTGTDFNGFDRNEVALSVNTYVFFNPHDVVQVYVLGGLGISGADVTVTPRDGESFQRHDEHYSYFGGQIGAGAEVRVSRRVAISGDIIGFVRGRTDDTSDSAPEFVDPDTHRSTNTSGGGLLRLGATFYW
jgi:opacity protein-like surface antigen